MIQPSSISKGISLIIEEPTDTPVALAPSITLDLLDTNQQTLLKSELEIQNYMLSLDQMYIFSRHDLSHLSIKPSRALRPSKVVLRVREDRQVLTRY